MKEAANGVFLVLASIMEDAPSAITAHNYEAAILLLDDFATAGRAGIVDQKRERGGRNRQGPKATLAPSVFSPAYQAHN